MYRLEEKVIFIVSVEYNRYFFIIIIKEVYLLRDKAWHNTNIWQDIGSNVILFACIYIFSSLLNATYSLMLQDIPQCIAVDTPMIPHL